MADKWYSSPIGIGLGVGSVILGLGLGTGYSARGEKAEAPALQEIDLNGNGIPDKFYLINGKVAVVELDRMPFSISLDTKVLEKEK